MTLPEKIPLPLKKLIRINRANEEAPARMACILGVPFVHAHAGS